MQEKLMLFAVTVLALFASGTAFAQDPGLATFQETAQVIVDKSISHNVTASITLQSTSIQELRIPAELEQELRESERVRAIVVTNQNQCILGVVDESCIMINLERDTADKGIIEIQESAKIVGDQFIDRINEAFGTKAEFHSVFVHNDDQSNRALETSGVISGRGIISVIYTMPMENTDSMYEKISALLLPKVIRDSGGFYDVALAMSTKENAKATFSLIPVDTRSLMQLKLAVNYPGDATDLTQINPLEFFGIEKIIRSDYFSSGFYPLNSLIQVVVLSPDTVTVSDIRGNVVATQIIDGEKIPTDISRQGWVFDPEEGQRIQGMYIFGDSDAVSAENLKFAIGAEEQLRSTEDQLQSAEDNDSIVIAIIIAVVATAAIVFYLKGYKK